MRNFYLVLEKIKTFLEGHSQVNVVTTGDIFDVDLNKQTIFPLSHIIINSANLEGPVIRFNISVLAIDIVNETKEDLRNIVMPNPSVVQDPFYGTNNTQDILNTQLAVCNALIKELEKGDLHFDKYQLQGVPQCLPFSDRFENLLAGWNCTFDIVTANTEISVC